MGILQRLIGKSPSAEAELRAPVDREGLLRFIAREGAWLLAREITEQGQATFIDYTDDEGRRMWPLFSTQAAAAVWVRESGVRQVTVFPCLQLTPKGVVDSLPANFQVIFDPKSPHERIATADDIAFLKDIVAAAGTG